MPARNVVLATGAYQVPKIPALAAKLPAGLTQLHTHDYRNPSQLPTGAVLIVGTGQSGGQIAEELHAAGCEVHLSVSVVPEAPRRYRGQDLIYWLLETGKHGPDYGVNGLTTEAQPSLLRALSPIPCSPASMAATPFTSASSAAAACTCTATWKDRRRRPYLSDDLAERLTAVEEGFAQRSGKQLMRTSRRRGLTRRSSPWLRRTTGRRHTRRS